MAWSLPRLLRRLAPELAHFQHALPLGYRGRSVVTLHDLSFERDPTLMGRARPAASSRRSCRARRAAPTTCSPSPSGRSATSSSSTACPRAKVTVTPNGVDPRSRPAAAPRRLPALRRRDPGAQGPARRARGGARRSACRSSSSARRRSPSSPRALRAGGADLRGYVTTGRARRPLPRRRRCSSSRRASRASGCRCSRRWPAARRSSPPTTPALREVAGDAAVYAADGDFAAAVRRALADRDGLAAAGHRAREALLLGRRPRAGRAAVYRQVLAS